MTSRLPTPLPAAAPPPETAATWAAHLQLGFGRTGERTVLRENRHSGPLRVQKALYPEGDAVCQTIVLHPPSGIAGGDELAIGITVDREAHAQITTPGAGKWYRSNGAGASQHIALTVGHGGTLEWLPQETIVFDGARADMQTRVDLAADSRYLSWDILCLGRAASGEDFARGEISLFSRVDREGRPIWLERGQIQGSDAMLASPAGWAGHRVCATLICSFPELPQQAAALLASLRAIVPNDDGLHGITALPDPLIARYLGDSSEAARQWLAELWNILRPACCGRPAVAPRIWNT